MSSENGGKGEAAAVAVDPPSSPPTSWKVTEPMQREGGRAVRKNSKKGKRQGAAQQPEEEVNLVSPWIEESDTKHEIDNGGLAIWPGTEGGEKTDVSKPAARKESARKRAGKKGKGNSGATAAAVAVASPEKKANATNTNANANAPRRAEEKADDGGGGRGGGGGTGHAEGRRPCSFKTLGERPPRNNGRLDGAHVPLRKRTENSILPREHSLAASETARVAALTCT